MRTFSPLLAACLLGACSIVMPSGPHGESLGVDYADVTGSISKAPLELAPGLDSEDQRRATAALGTALDPQGEGGGVNWDNPQTGAKGNFTPVGQAYPTDGKVCRAFQAEVITKETAERVQGTACRDKTADWVLADVKPWRKG